MRPPLVIFALSCFCTPSTPRKGTLGVYTQPLWISCIMLYPPAPHQKALSPRVPLEQASITLLPLQRSNSWMPLGGQSHQHLQRLVNLHLLLHHLPCQKSGNQVS